MGFLTKSCSLCGSNIFALGGYSLKDGCYCKHCKAKLSPFFTHEKTLTINDIQNQLKQRSKNEEQFAKLVPTKTIGNNPKLLIDENSGQFAVLFAATKHRTHTPDVINVSQLTDCTVEINESKNEVKYKDFQDNLKSFSPPYYAYSYDFFLTISVSIPYINSIRIKLNEKTIDNDQPLVIEKTGGIGQMFKDALGSARSYNGLTSNIAEVQASSAYQKTERLANEMKGSLLHTKKSLAKESTPIRCPWCGCLVIDNTTGICEHCCGHL